jgi:hypothetical protein
MPLWPDAGQELGFSRNFTYETARQGAFPGAKRVRGKWIVFLEPFERACAGES